MDQRQAVRNLTLEEFLEEVPAFIQAFADAVRARTASGDPDFPADRSAPFDWWTKEIAAYVICIDLEEELLHRRARGAEN